MSELVSIARGLFVSQDLDGEGEIQINLDDYGVSTWLDRREVFALITHLGKVLDDADKKQETER